MEKPISSLKGVGPYYLKRLEKLGIKTVRDLLWHFPSRYEDFSQVKKISELKVGETCSIIGQVESIKNRRSWRRRMFITEALIKDDTGSIAVIWFGQPYLTRNIPKGALVSLAGKVLYGEDGIYFSGPAYEVIQRGTTRTARGTPRKLPSADAERRGNFPRNSALSSAQIRGLRHTAGLIPIYPETRGITSRAIRFLIKPVISKALKLPDILPQELRKKHQLLEFKKAITEIHFPSSLFFAQEAKKRFAFEELFLLQVLLLSLKRKVKGLPAPIIKSDIELVKKFLAALPFELTEDQKQASWQIVKDIAKPHPMNRLLNGDVGSGKTIVATIASLLALSQKYQVALMAPTEILARQHFERISKLLEPFDVKVALLVAKDTQISSEGLKGKVLRQRLLEKLKTGEPYFVIGTHALIQKEVGFSNLALVIVDEQHRFGIEQRRALIRGTTRTKRGTARKLPSADAERRGNFPRRSASSPRESALIPHLLSMTATPIPRTLALSLYGDLDISILRQMPKGRQGIVTKVIPPSGRQTAYNFIREQIRSGYQAFIICPRIEAEGKTFEEYLVVDAKAVKEEYKRLSQEVFPDLNLSMLHGKMRSQEKELVMANFAANKTPILVSTSVIEVGIDIPNATVMMIEGADRFGLAQLHQFRGRVGRSTHQSFCFLLSDSPAKASRARLKAFANVSDGFVLAEEDLKIRGPGEFFGTRQSGLPDLAMVSLKDLSLVSLAREEAKDLLEKDPQLKSAPLLRERLEEFRKEVHLE